MTILCNFCLKPSDSCSSVDETQKENLKLIFNNELPITENCLICAECTHKVSSASDIKSACTYNANLMGTYEIDKTGSDKLIDIYLKKNNLKCDFFPNELSICRFCITVVSESNFTLKKDLQDDMNVGEMIKIYFPEVDLGVTKNPILCNKCIKKIQDYEMFVNSIAKNFNSAISNLNNMEKLKVTNIDPQHSDISDTNITNITEEIFTVEGFENEMGENVRNEDFIRDNIEVDDLKDPVQGLLIKTDLSFSDAQLENVICNYEDFKVQVSIEKNENLPSEHEMKHPVEGLLIKTELTSSDVKLGNDVICNYDNFKVQLSVDKNEKALPDPKIEFKGFVLKEEEISIYDVTNHDNSRTFEKDSETLSLVCNDNQGIKQESFQILSSTKQCYHNMSKDTNVNSTSSSRQSPMISNKITILCNFCLKPSDSCSSVDETQKENLQLIFNNELPITENCSICAECSHKVSSASDIKSACTYNANLMGTYETDKTGSDKLIDVYLKKNNLKCDFIPNELSICRFCITVVSESNFTLKKDLQDDMYVGEMIKTYFPEVDLGVTKNPIVCNKCIKKIQDYEMFVNSIAKNFNSAISNLNNMEKLKVTNIDPQHSDISDTNITNITEEIFTVEGFENEMGENVRNEDFIRDNIEVDDLKDPVQGLLIKTDLSFSDAQLENVICNYEDFKVQVSIEKNENLPSEHEMKHPVEGLLIKTELTSSDVELGNDVICNYDNFKVQLSVDKNEKALPDPKIEFKGFVLKEEEEISIYDVTNHDNSRTFEKDSETLSLVCNDNQGIKQESFRILSSTKQCYHNMSKDTNVNSTSSSRQSPMISNKITILCNFCLKPSDSCSSVDETQKENLQLIFNNELPITENCSICAECSHKVSSASDIKSACTYNANLMGTYETDKTGSDKLIDVYLKKNNLKCDFFPNELSICRFCITVVSESNFTLKKDLQDDMNVGEMIKIYFPEVDFTVTSNPIVCKTCFRKLQDYRTLINNWLEVSKLILRSNIGAQHSDNYDIHSIHITKEVCIKVFENKAEGNEKNIDCVDNENEIEIHDELKHSAEDDHIKSESVTSDVQLRNDDFQMEESEQKVQIFQFESKMESDDYILKEEEIFINDVKDDDDDSIVFEDYSGMDSNTSSLCKNNQGIQQQKLNEFCTSSEHKVASEISMNSKNDLSSSINVFPEMEQERLRLTKKPIQQLMESRNSVYRSIKINDVFRCVLCPFENQAEAQVEEHFENYHVPKYTCSIQDEIVESHSIVHPDESNFSKCEHCDYKPKDKRNLRNHLLRHSDESIFYKCEHCDYKSKHKCRLKTHLLRHSDESNFYKCAKYKDALKEHLKNHSESIFYKCAQCDYKSKYKRYLKQHLLMHSDKTYKCEHCHYKSKNKYFLKQHLRTHSGETYKCEHCDYTSKLKYCLKQHLGTHSDETYKCEHCNYKSKHKRNLKRHLLRHSDESNFYKCEHCVYKSKYKDALKRHLISHSEYIFYKCEHCDFKCKQKRNLKQHLVTHSDETYKCEHCDYKSKHKRNLKKHLLRHSD